MSSLDEANNFVNCVMNRYKNDTVMRMDATFLLIAVPFIAFALGYGIIEYTEGNKNLVENLASVAVMMLWFLLLIMMFLTYRRLMDHSNRDRLWRDILIHYAKELGCDIDDLKRLDKSCRRNESSWIMVPASIILAAYFVLFVLAICYPKVVYYEFGGHLGLESLVAAGALFNFLMFILVYTYSMKYPYNHESSQVKFVKQLRYELYRKGLDIPEMIPSVRHMWLIIHIFLFVITGGLYSIYLIFMVYRSTNNHLYNQWSYEIKLMDAIITHEGGTGIGPAPDRKQAKKEAGRR